MKKEILSVSICHVSIIIISYVYVSVFQQGQCSSPLHIYYLSSIEHDDKRESQ